MYYSMCSAFQPASRQVWHPVKANAASDGPQGCHRSQIRQMSSACGRLTEATYLPSYNQRLSGIEMVSCQRCRGKRSWPLIPPDQK